MSGGKAAIGPGGAFEASTASLPRIEGGQRIAW
jgi:hypothetical protein